MAGALLLAIATSTVTATHSAPPSAIASSIASSTVSSSVSPSVSSAFSESREPDRDGFTLELGVFAATPAALAIGQTRGPELAAFLPLHPHFALAARAQLGFADENDLDWRVRHLETRVAISAAYVQAIGRARAMLLAGAGGIAVHENRRRHQAERMIAAGADVETDAWAGGFYASIEAALRLFLFDRWALTLHGGPDLRALGGAPDDAPRFGFALGLAIALAVEDR